MERERSTERINLQGLSETNAGKEAHSSEVDLPDVLAKTLEESPFKKICNRD